MEYTFKLSPRHELTKVILAEYSLIIRKGETDQKIAYANVIDVRLDMTSHLEYKIHLVVDGYGPIVIPSWTFKDHGGRESQSAGYALFVRVLHHYLKDKSKANFRSGKDAGRIWMSAGIGAVFSIALSLLLDYLGFGLMNSYVQALFFSVSTAILIIVFSIKKLPKTYNPANIPLQFLP